MAMSSSMTRDLSRFRLSRRGRKLQTTDDSRSLLGLPKEVPERTWVEILQKEENELICFDLREEIVEEALRIGYERYMDRQSVLFAVFCTSEAWLKLIDWHFYRYDPGEDPSAYPPCFIPKRQESWAVDAPPEPSPKDSWSRHPLQVLNTPKICIEDEPPPCPSSESIELPVLEPIPEQYWFPGRVNLTTEYVTREGERRRHVMAENISRSTQKSLRILSDEDRSIYDEGDNISISTVELEQATSESTRSHKFGRRRDLSDEDWNIDDELRPFSSERLQRITDYQDATPLNSDLTYMEESRHSSLKPPTPVEGSLRGAGDSPVHIGRQAPSTKRRSTSVRSKSRMSMQRSRLPPLVAASLSKISMISDCRLRNLRLDTHYDLSSEKFTDPLPEPPAKKKL